VRSRSDPDAEPVDLRLAAPALAAWAAAAGGLALPVHAGLVGATLLGGAGVLLRRRHRWNAALLVAAAALAVAALRLTAVETGPVRAWADAGAMVQAEGEVLGDPVAREGRFGRVVFTEVRLEVVRGRGRTVGVRSPVLVIADDGWTTAQSGQRVRLSGRLGVSEGRDLAAVLIARGPPDVVRAPSAVATAVNELRQGLRDAVAGLPPAERSLVPALVVGDDRGMPESVAEEFRATGLTHLLAVSGANLTLLLGFLLPLVRLAGVRARGLACVGMVTVVFFVLLARPDPSVLRAAAMGAVAMAGLGAGGRRRGMRALSVAVLGLVLVDPWLSRSGGFALSVLATAAIVLLAPGWRDAMARWMPRWLAEAISVPAAAQLACTPVIVAISGQVSLVAVAANMVAAPAVGPATVLGLVAALVSVLSERAATLVGWLAGRAAWWIVTVADQGGGLPGAAFPWPATVGALVAVTLLCLVAAAFAPAVLGRRTRSLALTGLTCVAIWQPSAGLGWPPGDWVLAMCDVGQGDALVLNAGNDAGVVVDVGPDPQLLDRCLDRLEVRRVPVVLISHLHADHAAGLAGVLGERPVAEVAIGPLDTPSAQHRSLRALAARHDVPVRRTVPGESRAVGGLRWTTVGPVGVEHPGAGPGQTEEDGGWAESGAESGAENDASVVLRVETAGLTMLLTGDVEPPGQQRLLAAGTDLDVDVLKVPHHGSRHQDEEFLAATSPAVALVSAGADNDYGHPSAHTLDLLRALGSRTYRTDRDGLVVVVATDRGAGVVTGGGP